MNRVTLLAPKQLGLFGEPIGFDGPLSEVCSAVYDPTVTLFAEALESTGVPVAVELACQSCNINGDCWVPRRYGFLTCKGYLARIERGVSC